MIRFERFFAETQLRNFSYLIYDDQSGSAWVIDPYDAEPFTKYIRKAGLSLKGILNTHQHFDHIRGNEDLVKTFNAPVKKLAGGEGLILDDENRLDILNAPGHTSDHQVFLWQKKDSAPWLYSGDTLFNAGVGNCKNGGNVEELFSTVTYLMKTLPLDTVLQPGHDYLKRNLEFALSVDPDNSLIKERLREIEGDPLKRRPFTLQEERETNPFLKADRETFIKLRSLRDNW